MSYQQSVSASGGRWAGRPGRQALSAGPRIWIGLAVMALGAGLFALGVFHGFEHGSCSSTGYSAHRGPVPTCSKGTAWWMLTLTAGVFVAMGGTVLAGRMTTILLPLLFICVGAPFVALTLGGETTHLAYGASARTGQLEAGIFGAAFVIAGVVWGAFSIARNAQQLSVAGFGGLVGFILGVAGAFAIAAGVQHAIGTSSTPTAQSAAARRAVFTQDPATVRRTNRALDAANREARQASRLTACVTAAGIHEARIAACERKYMP